MNIFLAILRGLKLPVKLLAGLLAKRRKKRSELEEKWSRSDELSQKQIKYVRNFAPIHYSWQRSVGRDKKKRKRKRKVAKKLNHSKV